ncbi:hypothetical protein DMUE_5645 [Dictyocoela muelleri]|nr:hypothetical protein DMUE_5645 [Dictyocoela muelleri]
MIRKLQEISFINNEDETYIRTPDLSRKEFEQLRDLGSKETITVLQEFGMIKSSVICDGCGNILNNIYYEKDRNPRFRCKNRQCTTKTNYNITKNTIFHYSKLDYGCVLEILYQFSCRRTVADTSETLNISKKTVIDFYKLFRSSLTFFLDKTSKKIGGEGIIIHFDETPMTHRHGGLGRENPSNTVWVVGAVDIHQRKCFLKFLPSRSRDDLFIFLREWILPGSVVHTDSHRSYLTLSSLGFTHFTVNHSRELVSRDGIHTNWIEGIFGSLKKLQRKYDSNWSGVENLNIFLSEFCFRYTYDAWNRKKAFLKKLAVLKFVSMNFDQ